MKEKRKRRGGNNYSKRTRTWRKRKLKRHPRQPGVWCYSFSRFDIDEFARVRRVVNNINSYSNCTIFYTTNTETDEIAVHVRKHFIFVPQIPDLKGYLAVTMSGFFNTVRELNLEIEKVRMKECET
ncbi:MAG: hypothetical protein J6T43_08210 [Prevotella sp.]|nr:hypothetical protein [Prevotella sp.]